MTYWDLVIGEILNKGKEGATYCFAPQGLGAGGGGGSSNSSAGIAVSISTVPLPRVHGFAPQARERFLFV